MIAREKGRGPRTEMGGGGGSATGSPSRRMSPKASSSSRRIVRQRRRQGSPDGAAQSTTHLALAAPTPHSLHPVNSHPFTILSPCIPESASQVRRLLPSTINPTSSKSLHECLPSMRIAAPSTPAPLRGEVWRGKTRAMSTTFSWARQSACFSWRQAPLPAINHLFFPLFFTLQPRVEWYTSL